MKSNIIYDYFPKVNSLKFYRQASIAVVGSLFKLLSFRHDINLIDKQRLFDNILQRDSKTPLLTIMNHASVCDDTFVWGHILPLKILSNPYQMRWTITAYDVCYTNNIVANIFFGGQCIPVWRNVRCRETGDLISKGLGVKQPSMDFCIDILNRGGWLNIFPQGKIIYGFDKLKEEKLRLRWGIGRLICESVEKPIILPIWHCGMDQICPVVVPYVVNAMKTNLKQRKVTFMIGEEIKLPDHFYTLPSCEESWATITSFIQERFYIVRQRAIEAHQRFILD